MQDRPALGQMGRLDRRQQTQPQLWSSLAKANVGVTVEVMRLARPSGLHWRIQRENEMVTPSEEEKKASHHLLMRARDSRRRPRHGQERQTNQPYAP